MLVTKEALNLMTMQELESLAFRTLEQIENGNLLLRTIKEIRDSRRVQPKDPESEAVEA